MPDFSRYSVTTFDPGASEVLTQGLVSSPASHAFLATSPAPSMTDGFEVFVHDVIAAITTWPWSSSVSVPSSSVSDTAVFDFSLVAVPPPVSAPALGSGSPLPPSVSWPSESAGRVARVHGLVRTPASWSSRVALVDAVAQVVLERVAEGLLRVGQRDAVLRALGPGQRRLDARTGPARACPSRSPPRCPRRGTCPARACRPRPARRAPSGGRRTPGSGASPCRPGRSPQVAPYSGDMLPIVARSASGRFGRPGP